MKNLLKNTNKFGVLAILFAALIITTQSAFKATSGVVPQLYYYDTTVLPNVWRNAGSLGIDNIPDEDGNYDEDTFRCEFSDSQKCSGEFNSTSTTLPAASVPLSGTESLGIYQLNP